MIQPIQYSVYKGMKGTNGAIQFSLQKAHRFCEVCKKTRDFEGTVSVCCGQKTTMREGAIFVDIASTKGENVYDWDNKIKFALSVNDLGIIMSGMSTATAGSEIKLMHDPNAQTQDMGKIRKFISITTPNGPSTGCFFKVTESAGEAKKSHQVPLTGTELTILMNLFRAAIPAIMGWN